MELITTIVTNALTAAIIIILGILIRKATQYADSFITKNNIQISNDKVHEIMDSFFEAVSKAIISTNQTYVNALKAEGKFDLESQKVAMQKSVESCKHLLTKDALVYLEDNYADFDEMLKVTIEFCINKSKTNDETKAAIQLMINYLNQLNQTQGITPDKLVDSLKTQLESK